MSVFRLSILVIFGLFLIGGVVAFALFRGGAGEQEASLAMWGALPKQQAQAWIGSTPLGERDAAISVSYRHISEDELYSTFIEALASGHGPDLILLTQESLLRYRKQLFTLGYEHYDERTFRDTYVQEAEQFTTPHGILAFPLTVDPLVTYWNRTIFSNAGKTAPPRYWHEVTALTEELTEANPDGSIERATVGLGEFDNIDHATSILSALIMQAGSPIVSHDGQGTPVSVLNDRFGMSPPPAEAALEYYTRFSDPRRSLYTWNRSLPSSQQFFLAEDAALYFGFASEVRELREKNPNLNFDVAKFPQPRDARELQTYGRMYGVAVVARSPQLSAAVSAMRTLGGHQSQTALSQILQLPPTRRDLLAETPSGAYMPLFYESAIQARGWLTPERERADRVFRQMVRDVTGGRESISSAVRRADVQLKSALEEL